MKDRLSDRLTDVVRSVVGGLSRTDPARQLARQRRRAKRSLWVRGSATAGLIVVSLAVGDQSGIEWAEAVAGGAAAVAAVGTAESARRVLRLRRVPDPIAAPSAPPLPPRGSVARPPLARLAERERALYELLVHMGPTGASPTEIWTEATTSAAALRDQGARLVAVEAAVRGATKEAGHRSSDLDAAQQVMLDRLEEGVAAYERLVNAAAEAVAASGHAVPDTRSTMATRRLEEAADALLGLAKGLREVGDLLPPAIRERLPREDRPG